MTTHYRAQFQTPDGHTYAVVDSQPITVDRLALAEALVTGRVKLDCQEVPLLIDLTVTPAEWLDAAREAITA